MNSILGKRKDPTDISMDRIRYKKRNYNIISFLERNLQDPSLRYIILYWNTDGDNHELEILYRDNSYLTSACIISDNISSIYARNTLSIDKVLNMIKLIEKKIYNVCIACSDYRGITFYPM